MAAYQGRRHALTQTYLKHIYTFLLKGFSLHFDLIPVDILNIVQMANMIKFRFRSIFRIYKFLGVVCGIQRTLGCMSTHEVDMINHNRIKNPAQEKLVTLIEHVCSKMQQYIYIQRTQAYVASCQRTSVLILMVRDPTLPCLRIFTSSFEEKENGLVCGLYWPYQLLTSS